MATLVVQQIVRTGALKAALVAADAAGDQFFNDGKTHLEVDNGGGSPITVTIVAQRNSALGQSQDETVTIPAGEAHVIGAFEPSAFNTDGSELVQVTYSDVTSVTVGAYSVNNKAN